ncbi:MAG: insulinase family protein [Ruminococcaceae bacterium]|nr:insulinase family protein [Oscillospiraceae bacterium]
MAAQRIALAKDVYLNIIPCDTFKSNYLTMNFITPLQAETAAQRAMVPRVLRRGCAAYPDMGKLTERMQDLYNAAAGSPLVVKRGEMQLIGQSAGMLDNSVIPDGTDVFSGTLELFSDIWFAPLLEEGAFRADYTAGERNTLADAIRAKINNKNSYAPQRCYQEMCRGERFGVDGSGSLADVESTTPASVFAAYKDILTHMPCEIYYVGRGNTDKLENILRRAFAGVDRQDIIPAQTEVIRRAESVREVVEEQPVAQSKLSLGFRTDTCEAEGSRPVMLMFNEIYGASPLSKLFMNVREKLSLCYYCSSGLEQIKGTMMVNCGIEAEKKEIAQAEILAQLDQIRDGKISDAELDGARKSLRCALTQIGDEPESMATWHLCRRLSGKEKLTLQEEIEQIESVSRDDIAAAAQRITLDTVYFMRGTQNTADEEDGDDEE